MTKAELVSKIATKTGLSKTEIIEIVEKMMEEIKNSLTEEDNVYLRGFGSFIVQRRAPKTARNISKNTAVIIPEHNIPKFKPSKEFIDLLKK